MRLWHDLSDALVEREEVGSAGARRTYRFGDWTLEVGPDGVEVVEDVLPQLQVVQRRSALSSTPTTERVWVLREHDGHGWLRVGDDGALLGGELLGAYGAPLRVVGEPRPQVGFQGMEQDALGLVRMGVRHLSLAGDGLWLQPEPLLGLGLPAELLARPGSWGAVYAGGDPFGGSDRSGYQEEEQGWVAWAAATATSVADTAAWAVQNPGAAVSAVASSVLPEHPLANLRALVPVLRTGAGATGAERSGTAWRAAGELGDGLVGMAAGQRTYQTYTKANPATGEVYAGRTSGFGTPKQNVLARDASHHKTDEGFRVAILDRSSSNPDAIRGREQQLIDLNGGAQRSGGTSGNAINAIALDNPKRDRYLDAATQEFGSTP